MTRYRINASRVIFEAFDDETVLINQDNGNYYSLSNVGAHIWEFVQQELSTREIVREIECAYRGNKTDIEKAVQEFLSDLHQEGLVEQECDDNKNENNQLSMSSPPRSEQKDRPAFEAPTVIRYTDMQDLLLLDPIHEVDESGWPTSKRS